MKHNQVHRICRLFHADGVRKCEMTNRIREHPLCAVPAGAPGVDHRDMLARRIVVREIVNKPLTIASGSWASPDPCPANQGANIARCREISQRTDEAQVKSSCGQTDFPHDVAAIEDVFLLKSRVTDRNASVEPGDTDMGLGILLS